MIVFIRSAAIAPGKTRDALTFGHQIAKYLGDKHGLKIEVLMPVGGNPNRIAWRAQYASLGEMEAMTTTLLGEAEYQELVASNAANLLPGSAHDDIWRTV